MLRWYLHRTILALVIDGSFLEWRFHVTWRDIEIRLGLYSLPDTDNEALL